MSFKKIPYGQSNFADLIENGYAYVDKTRFIELLEKENNTYQFFIRPRRFGKSLFLSSLENYYDLNKKDKFESIFGNFYIGKNPTSEQGKYAVIQFDFSGLNTDSHYEFKSSFSNEIQETVKAFIDTYKNVIPNYEALSKQLKDNNYGIGAMTLVYAAAKNSDIPIFVIIDEYERENWASSGKLHSVKFGTGFGKEGV